MNNVRFLPGTAAFVYKADNFPLLHNKISRNITILEARLSEELDIQKLTSSAQCNNGQGGNALLGRDAVYTVTARQQRKVNLIMLTCNLCSFHTVVGKTLQLYSLTTWHTCTEWPEPTQCRLEAQLAKRLKYFQFPLHSRLKWIKKSDFSHHVSIIGVQHTTNVWSSRNTKAYTWCNTWKVCTLLSAITLLHNHQIMVSQENV